MGKLMRCTRGATAIEYGLFLALAAIVLSSGIGTIGDRIGGTFSKAGAAMAAQAPRPEGPGGGGETSFAAGTDPRTIRIEREGNGFLDRHGRDGEVTVATR